MRGKAADWDYTITVSAAEIYNEALRYSQGEEASLETSPRAALPHIPPPLPRPHILSQGSGRCIWTCKDLFLIYLVHIFLPMSSTAYTGSQLCHHSQQWGYPLLPLPLETIFRNL